METIQAALDLEKHVNQVLLDLHQVAENHRDPQVRASQICCILSFRLQTVILIFLCKLFNICTS